VRPTYETEYIAAESYVLDYNDFCYGKTVKTRLVKFLREEKKFADKNELINAIKNDAEYVKTHSK